MFAILDRVRDSTRQSLSRFSRKMGETLGVTPVSIVTRKAASNSMWVDLPSFVSLLPYESIDDKELFINSQSVGFGLHLEPSAGADESLMNSVAELLKNKLPAEACLTFMLYKHHYLASALGHSYEPILKKGGIYAELARMSLKFHLEAIHSGYKNGRNVPAQLADYCCYIFVSLPKRADVSLALHLLRDDLESELKVGGLSQARLEKKDMQILLRTLTSPNLGQTAWPIIEDEPDELIAKSIPRPGSVYEINDKAIDIHGHDDEGKPYTTRVVNCEIKSLPKEPFALWQTPDLFANLLRPEQGIPCPFLISFSLKGVNQEQVKTRAKRRASSLEKNNNSIQRFLNPSIVDEAKEALEVHNQASKDNLNLMPGFYNLILFTSSEMEREHVAKAIGAYRQMGFNLAQAYGTQWLRYLASLPFILSEGYFSRFEALGLTRTLSHYNAANLVPIVSDFKGSSQGLLLPTYRHQAFFLDSFDDRALPITNYNRLTIAATGAGKSLFEQAQILDGLSRGQLIFVIDVGDSYKHLCQMVGGTYIDATTLNFNPFTLFDFEGKTEIGGEVVDDHVQIRDLMAIMASPNEPLGDIQKAWLLDAIRICWKVHGTKSCIDDVLQILREMLNYPDSKNDRRLKDLLILLKQYGKEGLYGPMFNSETPLLSGSNFVVLEMGGFKANPELASIVMFALIVIIQGQFYHSDRRLKKRCVIDEAWRFLTTGSNPIAASFIEQGFRTARKHGGGFAVITQQLEDTTNTIQGKAIANSADTKIIMRQGDFTTYMKENPDAFSPLQQKMIRSFGEAKLQGFSNLMLQFGNVTTFHRYFADPFLRVLLSTSGEEFGAIEALVSQGMSLADAVSQVAHHYYGYGEALCA